MGTRVRFMSSRCQTNGAELSGEGPDLPSDRIQKSVSTRDFARHWDLMCPRDMITPPKPVDRSPRIRRRANETEKQ